MAVKEASLIGDRYRLIRQLGEGGMGRVWLARDEILGRDVAIKEVVPPAGLTDEEREATTTRTLREARAIARLNHPNVVRIYDVVQQEQWPWIVMEYVPSRSLEQVIAEDGPMTPVAAARIGLDMLSALRAAHRAGILHRDVKPGNVLIADDGRVVLTDFGLATMEGDASVTRSGLILGSPAFMAPERARDGVSLVESDLWSLGATLFAMVEGQSPYARSTAMATLAALASEEPDPAPHAGPLRPVLAGLLRKDPDARLSAQRAGELLTRVADGGRAGITRTRILGLPRQRATENADADTTPVSPAVGAAAAGDAGPRTRVLGDERRAPLGVAREERNVYRAGERDRLRRRQKVVIGLVALLVVVLIPLLVVLSSHNGLPTVGRSPAGHASGAAPAPSLTRDQHPQPTAAPSTVPADGGTGAGFVLPAGFHWYTDRTGFKVALPDGWTRYYKGTMVYFKSSSGQLIGFDQTDHPKTDPVADWRHQRDVRVAAGDFPDYQEVGIYPVDFFYKSADWEFRYTSSSGGRQHVINRGTITQPGKRAYGFWWSTPDSTWSQSRHYFDTMMASFQPERV
jgi:hypothetical protein